MLSLIVHMFDSVYGLSTTAITGTSVPTMCCKSKLTFLGQLYPTAVAPQVFHPLPQSTCRNQVLQKVFMLTLFCIFTHIYENMIG